jgi:hypothetical protein
MNNLGNGNISTNYIYLLQLREFIKTKENIYKIGRTTQENYKRFHSYPKGSILLFQMICSNCKEMEKVLIKIFKNLFIQRKEIGTEYFEGDYQKMIDIIYSTIRSSKKSKMKKEKVKEIIEDNLVFTEEETIQFVKSEEYQKKAFEKVCEEIRKIFPDYEKDVAFGGKCKFVKLENGDNCSINPDIKTLVFNKEGKVISQSAYYDTSTSEKWFDFMNKNFDIISKSKYALNLMNGMPSEEYNYFHSLIEKKIIISGVVYDLNSLSLLN